MKSSSSDSEEQFEFPLPRDYKSTKSRNGRQFEMEQNPEEVTDTNEWDTDATELLERGPLDITSLRSTKGSGLWAATKTATNRSAETGSPNYMPVFNEVFEVKSSALYLELETLPLDGQAMNSSDHLSPFENK